MRKLILFLLISLPVMSFAQKIKPGLYATYLDRSSFAELNLKADGTFIYYYQSQLFSPPLKEKGKWVVKNHKLLLTSESHNYPNRHNEIAWWLMPYKWHIKGQTVSPVKPKDNRTMSLDYKADEKPMGAIDAE